MARADKKNLKYKVFLSGVLIVPTRGGRTERARGSILLDYNELSYTWRRANRNGNWRKLRTIDKVFYRAAMLYARMKNRIINNRIISQLRSIFEKLRTTISRKIITAGMERVKEMLAEFEERGVFKWAPQMKSWFKDARYVFWLGLNSQAPHNKWII